MIGDSIYHPQKSGSAENREIGRRADSTLLAEMSKFRLTEDSPLECQDFCLVLVHFFENSAYYIWCDGRQLNRLQSIGIGD